MSSMSEIPKHRESEAISDTVELAFWGIEFEDCTSDMLGRVPEGEEGNIFECHMRQKSGYDSTRECAFTAAQIKGLLYDRGLLIDADMVIVFWDDGMKVGVDMKDLFTEQRAIDMNGNDEKVTQGDDAKAEMRQYVKAAVAQLIDVAS